MKGCVPGLAWPACGAEGKVGSGRRHTLTVGLHKEKKGGGSFWEASENLAARPYRAQKRSAPPPAPASPPSARRGPLPPWQPARMVAHPRPTVVGLESEDILI